MEHSNNNESNTSYLFFDLFVTNTSLSQLKYIVQKIS